MKSGNSCSTFTTATRRLSSEKNWPVRKCTELSHYDYLWSELPCSLFRTLFLCRDSYFAMKLQWKTISPEQERRFALIRERKNLIGILIICLSKICGSIISCNGFCDCVFAEKDVNRTDRTHEYFKGENNPSLTRLNDILMTYCMYNFDLGSFFESSKFYLILWN